MGQILQWKREAKLLMPIQLATDEQYKCTCQGFRKLIHINYSLKAPHTLHNNIDLAYAIVRLLVL